jgi:hypothetical protein
MASKRDPYSDFWIGFWVFLILCVGEPDLLDALIHFIMNYNK